MQRALLQWRRPEKRPIIAAALRKAGREDLVGYGRECLIRPLPGEHWARPQEKHKPGTHKNGKDAHHTARTDGRPPKHGGRPPQAHKPIGPKKGRKRPGR